MRNETMRGRVRIYERPRPKGSTPRFVYANGETKEWFVGDWLVRDNASAEPIPLPEHNPGRDT